MNVSTIDHETLREVVERSRPKSWFYRQRWFLLCVGLPTLLAAVYYGFIASPIYISQSRFVIKSPDQKSMPTLSLANLVQSTGMTSGQEQTKEIVEYVRSRDALQDLQRRTNVRAAYGNRGADFLSRFPRMFSGASFEKLYNYYQSMVSANVDNESGLAIVEVRAFTPEDAYKINAGLLNLSEALVNRLNTRSELRGVTEAQERVMAAEARLREARLRLSAFRNRTDLIDPAKQAQGVLEISDKLTAEQASLQAQLHLMERVAPRNPAIPALRSRISAVSRQAAAQSGRAVGTPTGIASNLANYEKLNVEQEFATQMLTAANASLEQARTEAQKQQFYLERVVEPNKPDYPTLPNRLRSIIIIFLSAVSLYFVGWMLVVGILEHAPED